MELFGFAFMGGIAGAVLMDISEICAAKYGISSGVNIALVGRWFLSLMSGQLAHTNITNSRAFAHEISVGWLFHFLVGGGCVALLYPLFFYSTGFEFPSNALLGGLLFGLATSLIPWFILLPSFGWGFCGRSGPKGSNALLASALSHIPYGLGLDAVISIGLQTS